MRYLKGIVLVCAFMLSNTSFAQDKWDRVINLEGRWKFTIGDKSVWRDKYFNDSKWEDIQVPSKWEDEGFNGYNGYAWYRKTFSGTQLANQGLGYNLFLGTIDDADEVYFNGTKIGFSGGMPPHFHTAYNAFRNYFIPRELIDFTGNNVIAVRVFDSEIEGGIVSGDVGIFSSRTDRGLTLNLRGVWQFRVTGFQNEKFATIDENKANSLSKDGWIDITVPGAWENQGFSDYDGGAWYKKEFVIPRDMAGDDLVLLLGKIDDSDKTFFNGKLVGSMHDEYNRPRLYHVTKDMFKAGETNTLIVYVDDPQGIGGIYEGPVGVIRQSEFTRYIRWKD